MIILEEPPSRHYSEFQKKVSEILSYIFINLNSD